MHIPLCIAPTNRYVFFTHAAPLSYILVLTFVLLPSKRFYPYSYMHMLVCTYRLTFVLTKMYTQLANKFILFLCQFFGFNCIIFASQSREYFSGRLFVCLEICKVNLTSCASSCKCIHFTLIVQLSLSLSLSSVCVSLSLCFHFVFFVHFTFAFLANFAL